MYSFLVRNNILVNVWIHIFIIIIIIIIVVSITYCLCLKELSFCHKLRFSNSYNLVTHFPKPLIFKTINSGRPNSLSLKYQRFTPSGCKDIGIRKFKFVANQFLYKLLLWSNDILMVLIKYSQNMHTHNQTIWSEFCQLRFLDLCDICKKKFQIWDSAVGDSRSSIVQILSKIIMQTFVQKPRLGMNIYICMLSIVCGYIK